MDCKSKSDMGELAAKVGSLDGGDALYAAACICAHGMMKPQWWMRLVVWIASLRHDKRLVWLNVMIRFPEIAVQTIDATANWIEYGKDADGEGVGGFNQSEVDRMIKILND